MPETDIIAAQVATFLCAAIGAYGAAVLTRAKDVAADATVNLGRRLMECLLRHASGREHLEMAVRDLAVTGPDDADAVAALRLQVRKILAQDPQLAAEIASLLPSGPRLATGDRSVLVAGNNQGPITTGDHSPVIGLS
jgi:hypothetical protein